MIHYFGVESSVYLRSELDFEHVCAPTDSPDQHALFTSVQ